MKCKPWIRHFQPPKFQCFSSQCALHGLHALDVSCIAGYIALYPPRPPRSCWNNREGVPPRGVALGPRFQTQRRHVLIRIWDVSKPALIHIKHLLLSTILIWKPLRLSTCPERTVAPDARPRMHCCGTPLRGTPLSMNPKLGYRKIILEACC